MLRFFDFAAAAPFSPFAAAAHAATLSFLPFSCHTPADSFAASAMLAIRHTLPPLNISPFHFSPLPHYFRHY